MLTLLTLYLQLSLSAKYVEYKFGVSYGNTYIDYSGRNFHGSNGGSSGTSHVTHSDRGVYIGGGDKHVLLPEGYSTTKLSSTFSILLWAMPKVQSGRIFYRGTGETNNLLIFGETTNQRLNFQFNSKSVAYDHYLNSLSFETAKWVLVLLVRTSTNFKFYTDKYEISSATYTYAEDATKMYSTFIGSYASNKPAFYGFVWYFVINDQTVMTPTDYYSNGNFQTCTFGVCVSCTTAFKDPDFGDICLATVTDVTKNSNSATCSSSNGCSVYTEYTCTCTTSCTYSISTGVCGCVSTTGVSTTSSCSCSGSYTLRSQKCCNPKCATCSTSETCLTCMDPNGSVSNGACVCKSAYYGTPSSTSVTACSPCKSGCSTCTTGTDCSLCLDPNAEVISDTCYCKSGYYGSPSTTTTTSCFYCSIQCTGCDSSGSCLSCVDPNAEIISGSCACKSGYLGTPSSTVTTNCYVCKSGCSSCDTDNGCSACNDPNAEVVSNNCVCKSGYSGTPSLDSSGGCFSCLTKCSTCTTGSDCTSCTDPNAEISGNTCICKYGYYGTASSTTTSSCYECNSGCTSCTSSFDCSGCLDPNAEISGTSCVCKIGYLGTASRTTSTGCFICNSKCSSCNYDGGCTNCYDPNAMVSSNQCICKIGFFGVASSDSTTGCSSCPSSCSSCTSISDCSTCQDPNAEVLSGSCECKSGYSGTPSSTLTSTCYSKCPEGCSECVSNNCLSCLDPNAEIISSKCECKQGYFLSSKSSYTCKTCPGECLTCQSYTKCHLCANDKMTVKNGKCICPQGFYLKSNSCQPCYQECSSCQSEKFCLTCASLNSTPDKQGNCKCNSGFYNTSQLLEPDSCIKCMPECFKCINSSTCVTCLSLNANLNSKGRCECKKGYWNDSYIESYESCKICEFRCSSCKNFERCLDCKGKNTVLNKGQCVCQKGFYYQDDYDLNCSICPVDRVEEKCKVFCPLYCEICDQDFKCLSCENKESPVNGLCECSKGNQMISGECKKKTFKLKLESIKLHELRLIFDEIPEINLTDQIVLIRISNEIVNFNITSIERNLYNINYLFNFQEPYDVNLVLEIKLNPYFSLNGSELYKHKYNLKLTHSSILYTSESLKFSIKSSVTTLFLTLIVTNPASLWVFLNTIQLITLFPMASIDFSEKLLEFFRAIGSYNPIPKFSNIFSPSKVSKVPNEKILRVGITTYVFWENFMQDVIVLIVYMILFPFLKLGVRSNKIKSFCLLYIKKYKFSVFIRFIIQTHLEITIFSLIQIKYVI